MQLQTKHVRQGVACNSSADLKRRWVQGAVDYRDRSAEGIMRCKLTLLSCPHDHMHANVLLVSTVSWLACRFRCPCGIMNGVFISTVTQYYLNFAGSMFMYISLIQKQQMTNMLVGECFARRLLCIRAKDQQPTIANAMARLLCQNRQFHSF